MNTYLDKPISEIVSNNFKTAQVFEQHGINFCCGGGQSLQDACRSKGIDIDLVLKQLNCHTLEQYTGIDPRQLPLGDLTDYIVNAHHDFISQRVPLILRYILKIATKHGDRFPYMKRVYVLFTQINTELVYHLAKTENVIFPAIRELEANRSMETDPEFLQKTIDAIEEDYRFIGKLLQQIRSLTKDYQDQENVCTTFRLTMNLLRHFESDLRQKIHLEINVLFPQVHAMDK
jgi:regulator of cell morphogenesis and NO signaling